MLYAVAGDGVGEEAEVIGTLAELHEKAATDEVDFWFLLLDKDELTETDQAIVTWLQENEVYFEVVGAASDAYEGAQQFHKPGKDPAATFLGKIETAKGEEEVALLALFINTEEDVEEDAELYAMIEEAIGADTAVFLLNERMVRLELSEAEGEGEEVTSDDGTGEDESGDPDDPNADSGVFTEAELNKMTVPELQAVARGQGIATTKGQSKKTLIAALLDASAAPSANGDATPIPTPAGSAVIVVMVDGGVHVRFVAASEAKALIG